MVNINYEILIEEISKIGIPSEQDISLIKKNFIPISINLNANLSPEFL